MAAFDCSLSAGRTLPLGEEMQAIIGQKCNAMKYWRSHASSHSMILVQTKHGGCCCEQCTRTSRLIRLPNSGGNYARWLDAATEGLQRGDQEGGETPNEAARQVCGSPCDSIKKRLVYLVRWLM